MAPAPSPRVRWAGSYSVFVEEDWKGKVLVYHLRDPLDAGD